MANEISVRLTADGKRLNAELTKAQRQMQGFASRGTAAVKALATGFVALSAAAAATGAVFIKLANDAAEAGDRIDKASQRAGTGAAAFQELEFAASQSGVAVKDLERALATLANTDDSLLRSIRDTDGRLEELADRVKNASSAAEGLRIASDELGEGVGRKLTPLLLQGSSGIRDMREEAQRLGIVMSDEAVKAAVRYTDQLDKLKRQLALIKLNLGAELLNSLTALAEKLSEFLVSPEGENLIDKITDSVENLANKLADLDTQKLKDIVASSTRTTAGLIAGADSVSGVAGARVATNITPIAAKEIDTTRLIADPNFMKALQAMEFELKETGQSLASFSPEMAQVQKRLSGFGAIIAKASRALATAVDFIRPLAAVVGELVKAFPLVGRGLSALGAIFRFFTFKMQAIIAIAVGAFDGGIKVFNALFDTTFTGTDVLKGLWFIVSQVAGVFGDLLFILGKFASSLVQAAGAIVAAALFQFDAAKKLAAGAEEEFKGIGKIVTDRLNSIQGKDFSGVRGGSSSSATEKKADTSTGGGGNESLAGDTNTEVEDALRKSAELRKELDEQIVALGQEVLGVNTKNLDIQRKSVDAARQFALSREGITDKERALLEIGFQQQDLAEEQRKSAEELLDLRQELQVQAIVERDLGNSARAKEIEDLIEKVRLLERARELEFGTQQGILKTNQNQVQGQQDPGLLAQLQAKFNEELERATPLVDVIAKGTQDIATGFVDALRSGESFGQGIVAVLNQVLETIAQVIIQQLILNAISAIGGGVGGLLGGVGTAGAGGTGALGGGASFFAKGGVGKGLAVVGENGPEFVNLGSASRVLSNTQSQALSRGSSGVSVQVVNQVDPSLSFQPTVTPDGVRLLVRREMSDDLARNGNITQQMGSTFGNARAVRRR